MTSERKAAVRRNECERSVIDWGNDGAGVVASELGEGEWDPGRV